MSYFVQHLNLKICTSGKRITITLQEMQSFYGSDQFTGQDLSKGLQDVPF